MLRLVSAIESIRFSTRLDTNIHAMSPSATIITDRQDQRPADDPDQLLAFADVAADQHA